MPLKCDVCDKHVPVMAGYALTTEQVVTKLNYWEYLLKHSWVPVGINAIVMEVKERNVYLAGLVGRLALSPTPWCICDSCITLFDDLDRAKARSAAKEYWSVPNVETTGWTNQTGTGDVVKAYQAFVVAWTRVFGSPPYSNPVNTHTPETAQTPDSRLTEPQKESKKKSWKFWK